MVEKKDVQKAKSEQKKAEPQKAEEKPEDKAKAVAKRPAEKPEEKKPKRIELRSQDIIRLAETNLDGTKPVKVAVRRVQGIGFVMSNAIAAVCGFGDKKLGDLTEEERHRLEDILTHPENYNIPPWLYNRRADPVTGQNRHTIASQLDLSRKTDIGQIRKLKTYKGVRHSLGLPVRGQRTRSSFRHEKSVGVVRKSAIRQAAKPEKEKK
jgi:small subunit ribosomal protein S13